MAAELWEIRDFLAGIPAFAELPAETLDRLPERMKVRYLRRDQPFPPDGSDGLWLLRAGMLTRRDPETGALLEQLGEGDFWLLRPEQSPEGFQLPEDSLFYRLPLDAFDRLCQQQPGFALRFERSERERLQQALQQLQQRDSRGAAMMTATVEALIRRSPVTGTPDMSIRDAAAKMTEQAVSALLLVENHRLAGLITDRDLRRRCLATGIAPSEPVTRIMTRELITVSPGTPAFEASLIFSRHNIHHLPVVDAAQQLRGIVSTSDLLRHQSTHAVHLVRDVHAARNRQQLIEVGRRLPALHAQLVSMGADGPALGEAIVTVTDAMTRQLITLAEAELGPAPTDWAWLSLGSQGRREQTAHSDQDHALLLADNRQTETTDWFARLANLIRDGLAEAGLKACPGEVMASNPQWRRTLPDWEQLFTHWIENPDPKALMLACNFFDMRVVAGNADLLDTLWSRIRPMAAGNRIFHRFLAANAVATRPPLGFFGQLVVVEDGSHSAELNLKQHALLPLADIARLHAVRGGLKALHTLERLEAAGKAGLISQEAAKGLADAWRFFYTLRARHQAELIRAGKPPNNRLDPASLSRLERDHLRDAFRVVADHQKWLRQQLQLATLDRGAG